MRRYLLVLTLMLVPGAALYLPGAGAQTTVPTPTQAAPPGLLATGRVVYEARCSTCHGDRGQGTNIAPAIAGLGPAYYDFMMSTGRMPLEQPGVQAVRRRPVLSPRQIQAVTAFLVQIAPGGVPIPLVDPSIGNISEGQMLYVDNCAPCHGSVGIGGAVGQQAAPNLHQATATQVGEAVRIGPGAMPRFDIRTLSDQQLDSLVRYVLYLRAPDDRGGLSLGHSGPLIEGFLALTIGLGILILVTRYLGERTPTP